MPSQPNISIDLHQRVLHITLRRPEKRNALSAAMCRTIAEAVEQAQGNAEMGSILIDGSGQVFCAGMDFEEALRDRRELNQWHERLFTLGKRSTKPIVVAVNGAALGGGLGLAAQGHVVLAASGAAFGLPEIKLGLWPLMVYRSVEMALGARRTLDLSLTGRLIHAEDAYHWGLVSTVCHPEELFDRARGVASDLAKASPKAVEAGMTYLRLSSQSSDSEAMQIAGTLRNSLMETPDFKEGVAAFKEKREPLWPSLQS